MKRYKEMYKMSDSKFTENKKTKIIVNRNKSGYSYKVNIAKRWAEDLGLSPEDKDIKITFNGERIIIEKF